MHVCSSIAMMMEYIIQRVIQLFKRTRWWMFNDCSWSQDKTHFCRNQKNQEKIPLFSSFQNKRNSARLTLKCLHFQGFTFTCLLLIFKILYIHNQNIYSVMWVNSVVNVPDFWTLKSIHKLHSLLHINSHMNYTMRNDWESLMKNVVFN